jgi:hypothetical protein
MSSNDPLATLNPSIVGQAEKAHTAILKRVLNGTPLDEQQWITIQLALGSGERINYSGLVDQVSSAAKYPPAQVEAAIAALIEASLLASLPDDPNSLAVTPKGRDLVSALRAKVAHFIAGAYGSVPPEDLATTARVLSTITVKLSEKLARS